MESNQNFQLDAMKETMKRPEFDGFQETLSDTIHRLQEALPVDSFLKVNVRRMHQGYRVAIQQVSSALRFVAEAEGKSPFAALDKAIVEAREHIKDWLIRR